MQRAWTALLAVASIFLVAMVVLRGGASDAPRQSADFTLHPARLSPADLEIAGDLAGLPPGSTRYLTRDDLLALPQVRYTVTDDSNFTGATEVSGVALEELAQRLGAAPESEAVIAVCNDKYRAHYTRAYLAAHHPLLVLEVNGRSPADWPKDPEGNEMGPYLISHPKFTPSFKILSHVDEAQIPWGVVRLEFRQESAVFGAIAPRGPHANDSAVQAGFSIAQQNCFRCHNMGTEGGQKARLSWTALAAFATTTPEAFASYVRNPQAINPRSQMAASPDYDDATLAALEAYFATFSTPAQGKP
jgi:mono/diheme cytochrome c family protein